MLPAVWMPGTLQPAEAHWQNPPVYVNIRIFEFSHVSAMLTPPEAFKCLADETRARAILLIAQHGELCVCELMCALDDNQPKVSRHLAQLRSAGLLLDRRQGQWVYYRLNPDLPRWFNEMLSATAGGNTAWMKACTARLKKMVGRPARAASCC